MEENMSHLNLVGFTGALCRLLICPDDAGQPDRKTLSAQDSDCNARLHWETFSGLDLPHGIRLRAQNTTGCGTLLFSQAGTG
jgi:hypothetical protein